MERIEYLRELTEKRLYDFLPDVSLAQGRVIRAALHSLSAGGKRIRPVLTLIFCELCDGTPEKALDTACAIEYMHTFSLIHDDLPCMDDDDLRRGKPSCHKAFDEATALLAGDMLSMLPFEIIASDEKLSPLAAVKCIRNLSHHCGAAGMIGGQQIDTQFEGQILEKELLLSMYRMKTSDLLSAACECGVFCAESEDETRYLEAACAYAENLGLAFQIKDDILDITSTPEKLGKPIMSDISSGKKTFAAVYGIDAAREAAVMYTQKALEAAGKFKNNDTLIRLTKLLLDRDH